MQILAAAYAAAAVFIAGIALLISDTPLLMLCVFCAGFGIVGAQPTGALITAATAAVQKVLSLPAPPPLNFV